MRFKKGDYVTFKESSDQFIVKATRKEPYFPKKGGPLEWRGEIKVEPPFDYLIWKVQDGFHPFENAKDSDLALLVSAVSGA